MAAFPKLYEEVVRTCSFESMSEDLNRQLGESCTSDDLRVLIEKLESLRDEDLVDDAGDIGDFYWRLRTSISDALAAVGPRAIDPLLATLSMLRHAPTNAARFAYIEALGEIGDDRIIEELLPFLGGSSEQNGGWLVRYQQRPLERRATSLSSLR